MMTLDQIVEETKQLPPAKVAELESGRVQGIPGEEVSERLRKIVGR